MHASFFQFFVTWIVPISMGAGAGYVLYMRGVQVGYADAIKDMKHLLIKSETARARSA